MKKECKEILDPDNLSCYDNQCCKKTGVLYVYWNEFYPKAWELKKHGLDSVADSIRKYPIKSYKERVNYDFPFLEENIINDKNRKHILRLNNIVDELNSMTDSDDFTEKEFVILVLKAYKQITGDALDKNLRITLLNYC